MISILIYLLLGILLIEAGLPILEGIVGVFLTIFECWKAKLNVKITESNMKMKKLAAKTEEETKEKIYQIGFSIPEEEDEEDEIL